MGGGLGELHDDDFFGTEAAEDFGGGDLGTEGVGVGALVGEDRDVPGLLQSFDDGGEGWECHADSFGWMVSRVRMTSRAICFISGSVPPKAVMSRSQRMNWRSMILP